MKLKPVESDNRQAAIWSREGNSIHIDICAFG